MDQNYTEQQSYHSNMYFQQYGSNFFPAIDPQFSNNMRFNLPANDVELQKIIMFIQNLRNLEKR